MKLHTHLTCCCIWRSGDLRLHFFLLLRVTELKDVLMEFSPELLSQNSCSFDMCEHSDIQGSPCTRRQGLVNFQVGSSGYYNNLLVGLQGFHNNCPVPSSQWNFIIDGRDTNLILGLRNLMMSRPGSDLEHSNGFGGLSLNCRAVSLVKIL